MAESKDTNWDYKSDEPAAARSAAPASFSWEAPEYIEHRHGPFWYVALILLTALLAAGIYEASSKDIFAAVIIAVLGIIVGVFGAQKPAVIKYEITRQGLKINEKTYKYDYYKSFSIIREGSFSSANLIPLKRFMPPLSAYFPPADEKKIMQTLGDKLPYEDRQLDAIERLSRRLRL